MFTVQIDVYKQVITNTQDVTVGRFYRICLFLFPCLSFFFCKQFYRFLPHARYLPGWPSNANDHHIKLLLCHREVASQTTKCHWCYLSWNLNFDFTKVMVPNHHAYETLFSYQSSPVSWLSSVPNIFSKNIS